MVLQEHGHSAPLALIEWPLLSVANEVSQRLSDASGLQGHTGPDHSQARGLRSENCAGAIRPHDLVVAHVDDPEIAVLRGAIPGNGEDDVGIDGRHSSIDNLKVLARKTS